MPGGALGGIGRPGALPLDPTKGPSPLEPQYFRVIGVPGGGIPVGSIEPASLPPPETPIAPENIGVPRAMPLAGPGQSPGLSSPP